MNSTLWFGWGAWRPVAPRPARAFRVVLIACALVVLSMPWYALRIARATGNFVVNSSADTNQWDNFLTLREAMRVANGDFVGPFSPAEQAQLGGCTFDGSGIITGGCGAGISDNITFDPSVLQINLTGPLPTLTDAGTWIHSQNPSWPRIDASALGGYSVFVINGDSISISGLSIINGNPANHADIYVMGGKNAEIAYNYLGTVIGATDCTPSGVTRNSAYGVYVGANGSGGSGAGNGVAYIYGNTISCHSQDGIYVLGADYVYIGVRSDGSTVTPNLIGWNDKHGIRIMSSANNLIQGNSIGVNGTLNRGNGNTGIYLDNANNNTITANTISANGWTGVWAYYSHYNTINSNKIGTNDTGASAMANGYDGIALTDGSHHNIIGGTTLADRNIISGNTLCGIGLRDGANNNTIDYNLIGLNAAGTGAIPNGLAGVCIFSNSGSNTIGSSSDTAIFQYIAGNTREGVYIENSDSNTVGRSNSIGTAVDNLTPRGNGREGVLINGGRNNLVRPNLIAHNGLAGVAVVGTTATGNTIRLTEVRNNGGLPIDLGNDGHTPNGSRTPPGPNDWLNYPVITNATTNGTQVTLYGTTCANCLVLIYQAIGNPTAAGGGGTIIFSSGANSYGNWSAPLPPGIGRSDVTLQTYQSSTDNSSEMSPRSLSLLYLPLILK